MVERLSCGCDPSLARAHHPECSGRHLLIDGHFWSAEEVAMGWDRLAVMAGRLWPNVLACEVFEPPGPCDCDACLLKRSRGARPVNTTPAGTV